MRAIMSDQQAMTAHAAAALLSIVIPAKNEVVNLVPLIEEIAAALASVALPTAPLG